MNKQPYYILAERQAALTKSVEQARLVQQNHQRQQTVPIGSYSQEQKNNHDRGVFGGSYWG